MHNGWWVQDVLSLDNGALILVSWTFWIIASIVLHELAHGWAALRAGDQTPRLSGHMTLNPVVHMGIPSLVIFAIVGIAWGAMPINPSRFRGRHADAIVALAGPLMNLSLAICSLLACVVWLGFSGGHWTSWNIPDHIATNAYLFLVLGAFLNIALMLFNLLPVPPLDGSRIVASFSSAYTRFFGSPSGAPVAMILFLIVFLAAGRVIVPASVDVTIWARDELLVAFGLPSMGGGLR
ncbi:MAG: site-2 protease family protein [Phycisphaeraceae bacterium]|nr:site-2 protease family protein [Phycisphaeraceae bacterium]